jgi:hypothetical protein
MNNWAVEDPTDCAQLTKREAAKRGVAGGSRADARDWSWFDSAESCADGKPLVGRDGRSPGWSAWTGSRLTAR